jgi:hypothetical protein
LSVVSPGTTQRAAGNPKSFTAQQNIRASSLNAGGTGYAIGDAFSVDGVNADAAGVVDTVSGPGAVLTYHLTAQGSAYVTTTGNTTTATGGTGTGLTLNTTAGAGSGLTVNVTVQTGDGTLTVTTWYAIAAA